MRPVVGYKAGRADQRLCLCLCLCVRLRLLFRRPLDDDELEEEDDALEEEEDDELEEDEDALGINDDSGTETTCDESERTVTGGGA